MKHLTLLLLAASINVSAVDLETCKSVSDSASKIMTIRQSGALMADLMGRSDSEIFQKLVIAAYSKPKYGSPKYIKRSIQSFSNDWYLQCVKAS